MCRVYPCAYVFRIGPNSKPTFGIVSKYIELELELLINKSSRQDWAINLRARKYKEEGGMENINLSKVIKIKTMKMLTSTYLKPYCSKGQAELGAWKELHGLGRIASWAQEGIAREKITVRLCLSRANLHDCRIWLHGSEIVYR